MSPFLKTGVPLVAALIIAGCGSIDHKTTISQPIGESRLAGVGDVVLRVTTEKSLPNAFGKADIFGRTTPTGSTVVVFEGVQAGRALFVRKSVDIDSRATTMNSSPIVISNSSTTTHSGNIGGMTYSGQSTTTGPTYVLPPTTPDAVYFDRGRNLIAIDTSRLPQAFVVDGVAIKILSAEELAVRYVLEK